MIDAMDAKPNTFCVWDGEGGYAWLTKDQMDAIALMQAHFPLGWDERDAAI